MQIKIPKVTVKVDLGAYAAELTGETLEVWVNPPLAVLREHTEIVSLEKDTPETSDALMDWYAKIWSQGAKDNGWTRQELRELEQTDPALFGFMIRSTWEARAEHLTRKKKS